MGRVARYKKVKSIDPFAKNGSWKSDVGDCATLHRVKRKSKTALKMKEQKMSKLNRRARGKKGNDVAGRRTGGSNGWGDDDGYDLPPEGGDEFDLNDLMGSVKKQEHKSNLLLGDEAGCSATQSSTPALSSSSKFVDVPSSNENITKISATPATKHATKIMANEKNNNSTMTITAKTPTREIIAACSNPMPPKKQTNIDSSTGMSKQDKRKAFFEKKKMKKRKRSRVDDGDDDADYDANRNAETRITAKKHQARQTNYSDTLVARTAAFDLQVERPPTFTMLPRGANKLAKNQKAANHYLHRSDTSAGEGDDNNAIATAQRIRKEKQDMEAMRERVMKQYAILRESRRNG
ncbi:hypothetical protein ACHAW5_008295 [Stephanodiscus triporus]|uniref:Ribosome biogenesis protein NOP53 n=1 Tax=Stephanodiscus triporus TaxID=2934178 RepID=A0ABD3PDL9_9STRA